MTVVCAWCGVVMHGELKAAGPVSHGICRACDALARADAGLPPREGPADEPEDSPSTDPALHDAREVEQDASRNE